MLTRVKRKVVKFMAAAVVLAAPILSYAAGTASPFTDATGAVPTSDTTFGSCMATYGPVLLTLVGAAVLVAIVLWILKSTGHIFGAKTARIH